MIFAMPERHVKAPGNGFASQSDLWAPASSHGKLLSIAVEAKAGEDFDKTVAVWLEDGSSANSPTNRANRLSGLCRILDIASPPPDALRYQLFHRAASAVLEARRLGASAAILVVQSFGDEPDHFSDFAAFAGHLGVRLPVEKDKLIRGRDINGMPMFIAWIDCPTSSDDDLALLSS